MPEMNEEDIVLLKQIAMVSSPLETAKLIFKFYQDLDRADRTPRITMYLHLGILCGIISQLTREKLDA